MACPDAQMDVAQRQALTMACYYDGAFIADIARFLNVSRRTTSRDLQAAGVKAWSVIDDDALYEAVRGIIAVTHPGIGYGMIESHLIDDHGIRVQRARILDTLKRCSDIRRPRVHRPFTRRAYYAAEGPMFQLSMDQNEKLVAYRIYFLVAIDAYTRAPLFWMTCTNLTGYQHSRLYHGVLRARREAPANTIVDGAAAWSGVHFLITILYGLNPPPVQVRLAEGLKNVHRFEAVDSYHNTVAERSWRDQNEVTVKYNAIFLDLENRGLLVAGTRPDPVDLFCLHAIFLPLIVDGIGKHWGAMYRRRKRKSTQNPHFASGTRRPSVLMRMLPSHGTPLTEEQLGFLEGQTAAYWAARRTPADAPKPWEVDPLDLAAQHRRASVMAQLGPLSPQGKYAAFRQITRQLMV